VINGVLFRARTGVPWPDLPDKRDYIFNGTLAVTAIVIWLRDTVQEPSETA
jgi:hypothetical protein